MLFLGVDAHRKISQLTVMDAAGTILKRQRIPSSSECFRAALSEYREPMKAVLEASYNWGPIYDWLDELVDDVVLAHPQKVRAIAEARIKTDAIDSATLAHLLRADLIPEAHAPSKEVRESRCRPCSLVCPVGLFLGALASNDFPAFHYKAN